MYLFKPVQQDSTMAEYQSYIILLVVWLIPAILVQIIFTKRGTKSRLPPGPLALPIIGHLHLLSSLPHQALHKLSKRYGPLYHLFLGSVPCVVVSSSEMAKEFLRTHEISFANRPVTKAIDYLTYGSADFSFAPYGPYWKFMKKIIMSELLGSRTLDQLFPVRQDETNRFLQMMLIKADRKERVDVGGALMRLSNNVISRMTMGTRCSENEDDAGEIRKLVKDVAELTGTFNISDYISLCKNLDLQGIQKKLKKVHERFDSMMERILKEHEEARKERINDNDKARDLLDILLDISLDESSEMKLKRENIKAFILDVFAAGTDATAITTEWAIAELIKHPSLMEIARKEIDSVIGKSRIVNESDVSNLPYLQAIVKETLRLHSSPLIVRESTQACTIGGYEIPAKTQLFINLWAMGRDPKVWESPLEFRPERFLGDEWSGRDQMDLRGQHFDLIPFGSGRRVCPGISLALQVIQTTLAAMIQCFEWEVDGGADKVDMKEGPGLTLPRAHPLICTPVARLNPFPTI